MALRISSLQTKVFLVTLLPLTVTGLLLSSFFIWSRITDISDALDAKGRLVAENLASSCEYAVVTGNREAVNRLLFSAVRDPDIYDLLVVDAQDKPLAYTDIRAAELIAGDKHDEDTKQLVVFPAAIYRTQAASDDSNTERAMLDSAPDVEFSFTRVGTVYVIMSREHVSGRQFDVLVNGLLIAAGAILITAYLAALLARSVTSPIRSLTTVVKAIKTGNLNMRIAPDASGEIGSLQEGINSMAAALEAARELDKHRAEDELFMEKVKAQTTLQSIGEGVITTDVDGLITYLNPAAELLTGWSYEEAGKRPLAEIFRVRSGECGDAVVYPVDICARKGELIRHDNLLTLIRRDGREFMVQDVATPLYDSSGDIFGMVLVFHDLSKLHRISEQLAHLASHDDLTGLFNRREFESQLASTIVSVGKCGREHALCYVDLDQFKVVNDTCGHHAGDELLKQLAPRISARLGREDILARLGGDEFGIILRDYSPAVAEAVANDIKDAINSFRFVWQQHVFEIGASIGLVPIQSSQVSPSEIMMTADSACFIAKDKGRNRVHVYRTKDKDVIRRTGDMRWLQRLNKSLEADDFVLYSQLVLPADGGNRRLGFYEVLIRARDENGALVLPGRFLPSAERYQLMFQIDRWVIRNVFDMLSKPRPLRNGAPDDLTLSINISTQSLTDESFLNYVLDEFEETGIDPRRIMFELAETAVIGHMQGAVHAIRMLKTLGCRFSLDDFGSGLSSFGYLSSLPVDFIKIDGRFVRDIADNAVNRSIVMAIADIAQVMGIKTIAEFVETAEIFDEARKCGIDYVQGWGVADTKPLKDVFSAPDLYLVSS